jgi:hypothetical protein
MAKPRTLAFVPGKSFLDIGCRSRADNNSHYTERLRIR